MCGLGTVSGCLASGNPGARVVIREVDGIQVAATVFLPAAKPPYPVVLWIHGGALIFGDRGMLPAEQRDVYLREGFAVVAIDYRLAPETKLDAILEDVDAAQAWLKTEAPKHRLDPDRLAVVGHSAGGYLALMTGVRFHPRPQAIVGFYGYGDISGPWYSQPDPHYLETPAISEQDAWSRVGKIPLTEGPEDIRFDFYRYTRQHGLWPKLVTGFDPKTQSREFDRLCPVRMVTADYPPTLLIHGERDSDVPVDQSRMMAQALSAKGVEYQLRILPGRDHVFDLETSGLRDPETAAVFAEVTSFLKRHFQP